MWRLEPLESPASNRLSTRMTPMTLTTILMMTRTSLRRGAAGGGYGVGRLCIGCRNRREHRQLSFEPSDLRFEEGGVRRELGRLQLRRQRIRRRKGGAETHRRVQTHAGRGEGGKSGGKSGGGEWRHLREGCRWQVGGRSPRPGGRSPWGGGRSPRGRSVRGRSVRGGRCPAAGRHGGCSTHHPSHRTGRRHRGRWGDAVGGSSVRWQRL